MSNTQILQLEEKLAALRGRLLDLETRQAEEITRRRIESDMGDDPRENEQAKLVMEQHDVWYIRKVALKKEMAVLKLAIVRMRGSKPTSSPATP